jgi:hypothetical protein
MAITALPLRTPGRTRMSSPRAAAVSWCGQAAMLAACRALHIQAIFTWGSPGRMAQGGIVLAVAQEVLDRGAVLTGLDHQ